MVKEQNRREFLRVSGFAAAGLMSGMVRAVLASDKKRPNIIFLMDDQHRWDALGIVNPAVKTPNLDALAKGS